MSLAPRAVALQGVGFGPLLVALHGLQPIGTTPTPKPRPVGGSSHIDYEALRRRRRIDEDNVLLLAIL